MRWKDLRLQLFAIFYLEKVWHNCKSSRSLTWKTFSPLRLSASCLYAMFSQYKYQWLLHSSSLLSPEHRVVSSRALKGWPDTQSGRGAPRLSTVRLSRRPRQGARGEQPGRAERSSPTLCTAPTSAGLGAILFFNCVFLWILRKAGCLMVLTIVYAFIYFKSHCEFFLKGEKRIHSF